MAGGKKEIMNNVIFLDIDGVLNCDLHYKSSQFKDYKEAKKSLRKSVKAEKISRLEFYKSQICVERIRLLNELCSETDTVVVISSTWRLGKTIDELQEILNYCGATFRIIGKTDHLGYERGIEISKWLKDNCDNYFNTPYYDFYNYAIIDDDSDMLLNQQSHFFQTDGYCGLTHNTCYRIKRFFTRKTFSDIST